MNEDPWAMLTKYLSASDVVRLREAIAEQIRQPPRIALIGQAGVGKSLTVNALFGKDLPVSHVLRGTDHPIETDVNLDDVEASQPPDRVERHQEEEIPRSPHADELAVRTDLEAPRGLISVIDMPGLGETRAWDQVCLEVYRAVLPTVDVALWILEPSRAQAANETYLLQLKEMLSDQVFNRIVFCVNKVDLIQPGEWNEIANLPSREQQISIATYIEWLAHEVFVVPSERIIAFSALKRYNLDMLLNAMLRAVPEERRLALNDRAILADPLELVDPRVRPIAEKLMHDMKLNS